MQLPWLTQAQAPLVHTVTVVNQHGDNQSLQIPTERALTVYVDKRELVTLMTLGSSPELLVLGWLRNQRLVRTVDAVESITVDWDVGVAAVKTRHGIADIAARTSTRTVTTGCGQGSMFGSWMDGLDAISLAQGRISQAQIYNIVNTIRLQQSVYKSAGSVHGCALFNGDQMQLFVEDVGRHNAIDTIAGWMWMQSPRSAGQTDPQALYTTGRLTSEMVIKAAQMGIAIVLSRSGTTQMGHQVANQLGLCTIGRATNKRFICFTAPERIQWQPTLAGPRQLSKPTEAVHD